MSTVTSKLARRAIRAAQLGALVIATCGLTSPTHGAETKLQDLLARELAVTRSVVDVRDSIVSLQREQASTEYAAGVLAHGAKESLRRWSAFRVSRGSRQRQVAKRARALYKLARGGALRLLFAEHVDTGASNHDRVSRARTLRQLVRNDLGELDVHQRAEHRAHAELISAGRELQSRFGLAMVHSMERAALAHFADKLDPELARAHIRRRRAAGEDDAPTPDRALMALIREQRRRLYGGGELQVAGARLERPLSGRIVGRFGAYEDRVLRLPMERNGIEVAARRGQQVGAIAAGRVEFVGELPAFAKVVVIDHGSGYLSLTGRLLTVDVAEGDTVAAGAALGRVAPKALDDGLGRTVYVELRHGNRPIDPTPYFRR